MNAVFGNLPDPREALLKAALLLQPGGYILISHPMGRAWHMQLHKDDPDIVPHELPDKSTLQQLVAGLPLQLVEYRDEKELYAAVLQVGLCRVRVWSGLWVCVNGKRVDNC
jgi:riboflavin kinase